MPLILHSLISMFSTIDPELTRALLARGSLGGEELFRHREIICYLREGGRELTQPRLNMASSHMSLKKFLQRATEINHPGKECIPNSSSQTSEKLSCFLLIQSPHPVSKSQATLSIWKVTPKTSLYSPVLEKCCGKRDCSLEYSHCFEVSEDLLLPL